MEEEVKPESSGWVWVEDATVERIVAMSFTPEPVGFVPSYPPASLMNTLPFCITSTAFFLLASAVPMPIEWIVFPALPKVVFALLDLLY
jgi:hypothetical protein